MSFNSKHSQCLCCLDVFGFGNGVCHKHGRDLNPRPCIYYALSIPAELSSRGQSTIV
ncbi:hypothetical protein MTR_2g014450 [Medicago truncatula]|uniref:Uncharacterized protein n=1 Tax=Medicago truncatula TaxID=3880 RepID=G7ISF8_MEDTR|nr:hypothetical protein MTR_2g014450 [Medicago truncatula]